MKSGVATCLGQQIFSHCARDFDRNLQFYSSATSNLSLFACFKKNAILFLRSLFHSIRVHLGLGLRQRTINVRRQYLVKIKRKH